MKSKRPRKRREESTYETPKGLEFLGKEERFLEGKLIPYVKDLLAELEYKLWELKQGDKKHRR